MSDIIATSTGKTFYKLDDGIAALLLEAFPEAFRRADSPSHNNGMIPLRTVYDHVFAADRVSEKAMLTKPGEVRWFIKNTVAGITMVMQAGREEHGYAGPAERAATQQFWAFGTRHTPPANIVEEYKRAKAAQPQNAGTDAFAAFGNTRRD